MITCVVCGKETSNPIEIRLWDDEIGDTLEADVCGGDCAKAWIESGSDESTNTGASGDDDPPVTIVVAEGDETPLPGWERTVEVADGKSIRYAAHAATDPETVAALDELAKAAYAHFMETQAAKTEQAEGESER